MKTLKLHKMGAQTTENEIGNHRVRCKFISAEGRVVTADFGHMVLNPQGTQEEPQDERPAL